MRHNRKVEIQKIQRHSRNKSGGTNLCCGVSIMMLSISTIIHGILYSVVIECETFSSILMNLEIFNPNSRFMNWSIPAVIAVFTCASSCTSLFVILIRVFETFQYLVLGDINTRHLYASSDCKTVSDANGGSSICSVTVTTP